MIYTGCVSGKKAVKDALEFGRVVGINNYLRSPRYKKEREQWVAGIFTLGIQKIIGKPCYLKMVENDPPDFELYTESSGRQKKWDFGEVEIVQIYKMVIHGITNTAEAVLEVLKEKKFTKQYPKNYVLCAYCNFRAHLDFSELRKRLTDSNHRFGQIWAIGALDDKSEEFFVSELWPRAHQTIVKHP